MRRRRWRRRENNKNEEEEEEEGGIKNLRKENNKWYGCRSSQLRRGEGREM